jgi:hypothetical protein
MIKEYFLDESGNSGDLARPGEEFDFAQQQIFSLACLGVKDMAALGAEIDRLKSEYRIQAPELKSTLVRDKTKLIIDLVDFIERYKLPLFIEIIDKRYVIYANMVSTQILPPIGEFESDSTNFSQTQWIRNVLADYLHARAPSNILQAFIAACDDPSIERITQSYMALLTWLEKRSPRDEIAEGLHRFAADSFEDFKALPPDDEELHRSSLPIPDAGKRGQSIWMLPNLSSLTHIYARINFLHRRRIGGVTLFHDQQDHFDDILRDAKKGAEGLARAKSVPIMPSADYHFEEQATLVFARSHESPGIQAADILAGFVMRFTRDILYSACLPSDPAVEAFHRIVALTDSTDGQGVNFVLSGSDMHRLGLVPEQRFSPAPSAS